MLPRNTAGGAARRINLGDCAVNCQFGVNLLVCAGYSDGTQVHACDISVLWFVHRFPF
jgi:hypothetical protein